MSEPYARQASAETRRTLARAAAVYLIASFVGHLTWEIVQIPLYTLWRTGSSAEIAFAILHCTGGDLVIAGVSLMLAIVVTTSWRWPRQRFIPVAILALAAGIGYTAYSEWLNVYVRHSWSYQPAMPVLRIAGYGIGLAPLGQWLIVPLAAFRTVALRFKRD